MTTEEGEQIAAARQDVPRLQGIICLQRQRMDAAAGSDLGKINRIVDAQQALLDNLSTGVADTFVVR